MRIRTIYVLLLMACIPLSKVMADGNITTTSGNMYFQPDGGKIYLDDANLSSTSGNLTLMPDGSRSTNLYSCDSQGAGSTSGICYDVAGGGATHGTHYFSGPMSNAFFKIAAQTDGRAGIAGYSDDGERLVMFKYNGTSNNGMFYIANTGGDIVLNPRTGSGGSLRPYNTKEDDLGSSIRSWDDCYCDDYWTTSRGYSGTPDDALNAVTQIVTLPNGEIDHGSVDPSLGDDETISTNAVTFGNSKAISALLRRIEYLESKIKELEDKC
ncbi:hypothetical protein ACFLRF_06600 [Candidatus Altiarchaeota archaeon]